MNNYEVSETQLVTWALAGDAIAFGKLYELYLDEIYHFVFYRVKSHQEAEDLSEAVFLKAWQALDENPPREIPFRLWLYTISRNTVIDYYRTSKQQVGLEEAAHLPAPIEDPEAAVIRWESVQELKDKLLQLKEEHQEVLTCRFVVGLSHADTATVMSRSEEAVRALQYRAIVSLRRLLTVEQAANATKIYTNGNGLAASPASLAPAGDSLMNEDGLHV
jgi:RNA polymerase sigma-70 factor (ECF subfamily)